MLPSQEDATPNASETKRTEIVHTVEDYVYMLAIYHCNMSIAIIATPSPLSPPVFNPS
jgi:hypothetical protein